MEKKKEKETKKEIALDSIGKARDEIYETWSSLNLQEIDQMKGSWTDSICDEYIKKLKNVDAKINDIFDEMETLEDCWKKYEEDEEDEEDE